MDAEQEQIDAERAALDIKADAIAADVFAAIRAVGPSGVLDVHEELMNLIVYRLECRSPFSGERTTC